jgi:hypothetical protein
MNNKKNEDDVNVEHSYSSRQFRMFTIFSVCVVLLGGFFVLAREYNDVMGRKKAPVVNPSGHGTAN